MAKDIVRRLLESVPRDELVERALRDNSCKGVRKDRSGKDLPTNKDLATLGDAVLRMCLIDIHLYSPGKLSHLKERYETDEVLVCIVGRHYHILKYLDYNDPNHVFPKRYSWKPHGTNSEDARHKHIATAVEALLGAVYRLEGLDSARKVVERWVELVDSESVGKEPSLK